MFFNTTNLFVKILQKEKDFKKTYFLYIRDMFSSSNQFVMVFAVLLGLAFICFGVYYVNKLFVNTTQDILVRFILMVFASLVGVFVVDKIIAFKINLLSDEQNNALFDLIKTLTLMIFSYYFGSQKSVNNGKVN